MTMTEHLLAYPAPNSAHGICHLRLFRTGSVPMVAIVGELSDNPGMSITNAAESIQEELPGLSLIDGFHPVVIEHYPAEDGRPTGTWDLVIPERRASGGVRSVAWKRLDYGAVAGLLGGEPFVIDREHFTVRQFRAFGLEVLDPGRVGVGV